MWSVPFRTTFQVVTEYGSSGRTSISTSRTSAGNASGHGTSVPESRPPGIGPSGPPQAARPRTAARSSAADRRDGGLC